MVRKPGTNDVYIRTDVYVSICETNEAQEASVVAATLVEVLKMYKKQYPSVKEVWLR